MKYRKAKVLAFSLGMISAVVGCGNFSQSESDRPNLVGQQSGDAQKKEGEGSTETASPNPKPEASPNAVDKTVLTESVEKLPDPKVPPSPIPVGAPDCSATNSAGDVAALNNAKGDALYLAIYQQSITMVPAFKVTNPPTIYELCLEVSTSVNPYWPNSVIGAIGGHKIRVQWSPTSVIEGQISYLKHVFVVLQAFSFYERLRLSPLGPQFFPL